MVLLSTAELLGELRQGSNGRHTKSCGWQFYRPTSRSVRGQLSLRQAIQGAPKRSGAAGEPIYQAARQAPRRPLPDLPDLEPTEAEAALSAAERKLALFKRRLDRLRRLPGLAGTPE
jgi:hypothetical protein